MFKEKNTVCPTCKTILSKDQDTRILTKHRRGRVIGGTLGILGGFIGASISLYFGLTA